MGEYLAATKDYINVDSCCLKDHHSLLLPHEASGTFWVSLTSAESEPGTDSTRAISL